MSMGIHSSKFQYLHLKVNSHFPSCRFSRQKDKLSFTSLTNKIKSGLKKGYSETEIREAVIKAVSPGLNHTDMLLQSRLSI